MDYSISKQRLSNLVGNLVLQHFPKFNNEDILLGTKSDGDDTYILYYGLGGDVRKQPIVYARYYVWKNELQLNPDLFYKLRDMLGEELMTGVLDWFNEEFEEDAENVTY